MKSKQRLNIIAELFNVQGVKLELYLMMLKDIETDELIKFYSFVLDNKEQYESLEVCTKRSVKEYKTMRLLARISQGVYRFNDIDVMIGFIKHNFKGKDLGYGLKPFKDFVIIAVDDDGNLRNKYFLNEFNKPSLLDNDRSSEVYEWLFKNQHRIGVVKHISEQSITENTQLKLANNINNPELKINPKVAKLIPNKAM